MTDLDAVNTLAYFAACSWFRIGRGNKRLVEAILESTHDRTNVAHPTQLPQGADKRARLNDQARLECEEKIEEAATCAMGTD